MAERTNIVFRGGHTLVVEGQANHVAETLGKTKQGSGNPFAHYKTTRGTDVYVAADQVAYVEPSPES